MVTKHRGGVARLSTSPSSIDLPCDLPFKFNIFLLLAARNRISTPNDNKYDPPADKSDAPVSTRHAPVVHHATHRCLTPTRKINSGEKHYEAYKLARQRACSPLRSPSCLALFYSSSSLVVLVPPGGVSGYDQATGNEEGERERERAGGLHFFLRYPLSISYLSSPNFTSMSSTVLLRILSKTLVWPVWPFTASAKRTHTLPSPRLLRYSYQK
jgi:hypothetical protein